MGEDAEPVHAAGIHCDRSQCFVPLLSPLLQGYLGWAQAWLLASPTRLGLLAGMVWRLLGGYGTLSCSLYWSWASRGPRSVATILRHISKMIYNQAPNHEAWGRPLYGCWRDLEERAGINSY
jgi:hypothetical protein